MEQIAKKVEDRTRREYPEVQAMLAILTEMNIERQLDSRVVKEGILFAEAERRLREQGINKT